MAQLTQPPRAGGGACTVRAGMDTILFFFKGVGAGFVVAAPVGPVAVLVLAAAFTIVVQVVPFNLAARVALLAALSALVMVFTVSLFVRRTQFTK